MRSRILSIASVILTSTLLVAGCSSGSSSSRGGGATSGTGSSGQPPGQAIKIGVICSCSGPAGDTISAIGDTAKAWAKSVNASGGLGGHPVDLIFKDDASNPGTSLTAAQSLISSKVAAVIDVSNFSATWSDPLAKANIPVVGGLIASPPYHQSPDFYASGTTNDAASYAVALTAKKAGATNLGQLYCAEAPTCQSAAKDNKAAAKSLGLPLAYSTAISATAPNYTAQCLAAKQANVTALFIGDSAVVVGKVAQDCARQDYKPIYVLQGGAFTDKLASTTGIKDNLWMAWSIRPYFDDTPAVRKMRDAVDKYFPGLRKNAESWTGLSPQGWTAGLLIAKAVQASATAPSAAVTNQQLTKGLDSVKNDTLGGWSPPLTFSAGRTNPVDCWYTAHIEHGTPKLTDNGKVTCMSAHR